MAKILLGITGSIAAYKSLELIRLLLKNQHEVKVILTNSAFEFITKTSILALGADIYSDNDVYNSKEDIMQHINLAKWPDLIIIAPMSANTLSKIANGLSDNLLTETIIASKAKVFLVPAMNMEMWRNSIIQENVTKLHNHSFNFIGPILGIQACGDNGPGRMVEPFEVYKYIIHYVASIKNPQISLKNRKVAITLGGTIEDIDPVRHMGNKSSGKMGLELAYACHAYGAKVVIIAANVDVILPDSLKVIQVKSAEEMLMQSLEESKDANIFIGCAAVADYKIAKYSNDKIKKSKDENVTFDLVKNIDIIKTIKEHYPSLFIVGFAAETTNIIEYAKSKLKSKNLNLIVANDVGNNQIFGSDETKVSIINPQDEIIEIIANTKDNISHEIISFVYKSIV